MTNSTNFYLHYQYNDNVNLQKTYAKLIERLSKKIYPHFFIKRKQNVKNKNILKLVLYLLFFEIILFQIYLKIGY